MQYNHLGLFSFLLMIEEHKAENDKGGHTGECAGVVGVGSNNKPCKLVVFEMPNLDLL